MDWPPEFAAQAGAMALVAARAVGLSWTAPGLSTSGVDARFRLLLGGMIGFALWPAVGSGGESAMHMSWPVLVASLLGEALAGAALGWSAALIVAGARQAGELVGAQGGFSPASLFDPDANEEMTALGHLYGIIAMGVFVGLDGPLALVRGLLESYHVAPPGEAWRFLNAEAASEAFARVGEALALALRAGAPAAVALAAAGVALGLLGRASPSLPLVALSLPVRSALGLAVVIVSLGTLAATFAAAWGGWSGLGGLP